MSSDTDMSSSEEIIALSKTERRDKKDKKEKKEKKRSKSESKAKVADSDASEEAETPAKKRKREILPDELEIDVNLPEPASKKAARKAKKAKLNPTSADGEGADAKADEAKGNKETDGKRSAYGVWIGNLPWSATKDSLRTFLTEHSEIASDQITRVHMPPPTKVNPTWTTKPLNKGFAYVDFTTELAMYTAIALTETKMDGRALLIKNAKSFEGRPDKPKAEDGADSGRGGAAGKSGGHPPNKRVFIGNLSFDVTKEDLQDHYAQCGDIADIHMATFEDSGKCKGYAWITFGDVEAATSAVKGFVFKDAAEFSKKKGSKKDVVSDDSEDEDKKPEKKRKWFVSKFMGRELRCEFAEDATTRYNKRWGKDRPVKAVDGVNPDRWRNFDQGDERRPGREDRGGGGGGFGRGGRGGGHADAGGFASRRKVDPRTIKSGAAHSSAPRASQAIVESQGKKTTFE
jgi:RNA recognition motif-containing protein